jgi:hypothetical protein
MGDSKQIFSFARGAWPWLVFAFGFGMYLFFQVGLVAEPFQRRDLPVEAPDAYQYIFKSVALFKCPLQDCPALKDLRPQVTPAPQDPEPLVHQKWRRELRLFPNYHPLFSLALMALAKVEEISYEAAYRQLNIMGSLLLAVALALFFLSLVGPLAAGISLAILSPVMFPLQGLTYMVPSVLSLGMGLLMFAYLAHREGRPGLTFYVMNLVALGLHPMGLIHTGLAVVFGVACRYPQDRLRGLKDFVPSLALMAFYWGLIHLIPPFKLISEPTPPGSSYVGGVVANFKQLAFYIKIYHSYGSLEAWQWEHWWPQGILGGNKPPEWVVYVARFLGVGLVIVGLRLKAGLGRKAVFLAAILLLAQTLFIWVCAGILLLTLVRGLFDLKRDRLPVHLLALAVLTVGLLISFLIVRYCVPASIATRAFVFWSLGLTAVFGRGLALMTTAPGLGQVLPRYVPASLANRASSHPWFWRVILGVFVIFCLLPQLAGAFKYRASVMAWKINRYDLVLDVDQPHRVLQRTSPGDIILYGQDDTQIILPFFLAHGCLARRAVYLPFLPLPPGMKFAPARVKILVTENPFLWVSATLRDYQDKLEPSALQLKNYLALPPGTTLTLHLDSNFQPEAVECLSHSKNLDSPGQRLVVTRQAYGQTWTRDFPLAIGAWSVYRIPRLRGGTLSIYNPNRERTVALAGLRLKPGDNPKLLWPWDNLNQIVWHHPSSSQYQSFSPPKVTFFQGQAYRMKVLQDEGASIVYELRLMP